MNVAPSSVTPSDSALHARLIEACVLGNSGLLTVLLAGGASANHTTSYGYSLLHFASNAGRRAIVAQLLRAGANPASRSSTAGVTPLDLARLAGHNDVAFELLSAMQRSTSASRPPHLEMPVLLAA